MKQLLGAVLIAGVLVGAVAAEPETINLDNRLAACVDIVDKRYLLESEMPYLVVEVESLRPTTECGCSSLVSAYRVSARGGGSAEGGAESSEGNLLAAKIKFSEKRYQQLPLAASPELLEGSTLDVTIVCARP